MSALESLIWNVLGYSSMPIIFLVGFVATVAISIAVLKIMGVKPYK
jgi:uncharacterized protein (TIGR02808 family)